MSAFFVCKATVDCAVTLFTRTGTLMSLDTGTEVGRALWAMNALAIKQRYPQVRGTPEEAEMDAAVWGYEWTLRNEPLPCLQKQLKCLIYQCSEGDVPEMGLFKRMEKLAEAFADLEKTAEYEIAPWGMDAMA